GMKMEGTQAGIGEAMRRVVTRAHSVVFAYAIASAYCLLWGLLLVLPMIWALVRYSFITQAIALHDAGAVSAIDTSKRLLRGKWWQAFGVFAVAPAVGIAGTSGINTLVDATHLPQVGAVLLQTAVSSIALFANVLLTAMYLNRRHLQPLAPGN